ncbi:hypothetical protein An02g00410 [Aspergillus niger]|uniref:Uncharacterized protein n=2 Tax=Aspergillus niger TaxID=5061 RepID=A2QBK9_ASPNC|nr:hypothetical protein An02g00410 [Aspergillus niger]CAK96256.1 hypothetical protein An02g00410 [Aspergillus niger]
MGSSASSSTAGSYGFDLRSRDWASRVIALRSFLRCADSVVAEEMNSTRKVSVMVYSLRDAQARLLRASLCKNTIDHLTDDPCPNRKE